MTASKKPANESEMLYSYSTIAAGNEPPGERIKRLEEALRNARIGTWEIDFVAGTTRWDATCREIFGMTPDEQIDSDRWRSEVLHPEDRERATQHVAAAVKPGNGVIDTEYRIVGLHDRVERHVAVKGSVVFEGGTAVRALGIVRDVTQAFIDQGRYRDMALRLTALTNSMPQMVWTALPNGDTDFFNQQWYEFTGMKPGSTEGEGWTVVIHPEDLSRTWEVWRQATRSGEPYEIEYRLRRRDGVYRWALGRALAMRDDSGRITHWFGTCTDIDEQVQARHTQQRFREALDEEVRGRTADLVTANTRLQSEIAERERIEAALRQAQKMEAIGQLTGGIAHDFNNLLTGIIGNLERLQTQLGESSPELQRYATTALNAASRAAGLTQRLLAFSRRQTLNNTAIDVNQLIRSMEDLLRRSLGEQIVLQTALQEGLKPVFTDANQLESALLNLVINARDAMPNGGSLTLLTQPATQWAAGGEGVRITVSDTGTGMPPDVLARAFDPFFTTKPIGQGTGLGLSMVYGFAQQSGGTAQIESALDAGTAVHLDLPVAQHAIAAPEKARKKSASKAPARCTLLIVEDDETVLALMAEVARDQGHEVLEAHDETSALPFLTSSQKIDLMVSDVGLPGTNGRQLAERARQLRPGLKVLFVTGYARDVRSRAEFLGEGMDMLSKPFALDALTDKIAAMLLKS